ncbi:glucosidase 2 subunit beta [Chrysochromulina tobinii]|uniref:Glucosidase 2 subunit beta n=1 Tax=Chrysochromulina tobinii TaxID=1460289 RepID=A0A0M0JAF1_9EUKA|nr:glucosidase 2 subunit beta [Chrysochromulina tobinii]|eukprot:KOO23445.1 glucosidase 2 subunit beta [Chrysochromulina sp. CCMP291]
MRRGNLALLCGLALLARPLCAQQPVRGVPRSEWAAYTGPTFACRDGSGSLPIAQLNDDYCDCTDGSDEPGTSACANTGGRFYCANKGFKPTYVRAGLVGDGICDCCDGTDEYARPGACTDTCIQAGEAARAVAAATLSSVLGGLQKAQQWEAEAATNTGKWDSEIAALKVSLIEKKAAADAIQVEKAAAELRESEARKEFLEKKAAEEAAKQAEEEAKAATAAGAGAEMPSGASVEDSGAVASDHDLSYPSVDHHPDEVGPEGEYPADDYIPPEGDAPYGDDPHLEDAEYRARYRDDYGEGGERFGGEDEDEHRPWSEGDDEPNLDDEPGDDEEGRGRRATWHEEDEHEAAQATETDEAAPKDPEAEALRTKHREAMDAIDDLERQMRELESKKTVDYGPNGRFEPLSRECYTSALGGEWNYEICPFKNAAQKGQSGGSTTIGNWEGFADDYKTLKFTNGQHCWNGPARSLTVSLECGAESEVLSVDEPEVCKYTMRFRTPAACTQAQADAAKTELDALAPERVHDEL